MARSLCARVGRWTQWSEGLRASTLAPPRCPSARQLHDAAEPSVEWTTHFSKTPHTAVPELAPTHTTAAAADQVLATRASLCSALLPTGCILLRGTHIRTAADMHAALASVVAPMSYVGGTNARKTLAEGVLDAGTEPPHLHIPEHSEMAYLDRMPAVIAFACLQPATGRGGATTVVAAADVERALPSEMVSRLRQVGVEHVLYYGPGGVKTWQAAFDTTDPAAVEAYAAARGWGLEWTMAGTGVNLSFVRASYVVHPWKTLTPENSDEPTGGSEAMATLHGPGDAPILCQTDLSATYYRGWKPFDGATFHQQPYSFRWGDGAAFTQTEKDAWGVAKEASLRRCQWQRGDVLVLDNLRMLHGRLPFVGDRTMAVVLGDPHTRLDPARPVGLGGTETWADVLIPER
jgi:hypothetical protein